MSGRFFGQSPLIIRRQNLSSNSRGGLNDQAPDLLAQIGQHAGMILGGGFARFDNDLFGGGNGLLCFPLLHLRCGRACFFDQLVRLCVRLRKDFLPLGLSSREFGFALLGVL